MNNEPFPTPDEQECYGFLVVQVTTARGAIPLEGAQVDIRPKPPEK